MKTYYTRRDKQILALAFAAAVVANVLLWLIAGQLGLAIAMALDFLVFAGGALYLIRRDQASRIMTHDPASNYFQVEALLNIMHVLSFDFPLPTFRNWAVSPDCCQELVRQVLGKECETVVECGSGVSTLICARALKKLGRGHVYSLESGPEYAEITRTRLKQQGLSEFATVITAPLAPVTIGDRTFEWYDTQKLELIPQGIDLLFVDGPPGPPANRPDTRYPAFPLLQSRLSKTATIVVDDFVRAGEQMVVQSWLQEDQRFDFRKTELLETDKGICILEAKRE